MQLDQGNVGRRGILRSGLASLAGTSLLTATDARAARQVTPNPIRAAIQSSGLAVELVEFSAPPRTSGARPYAMLNFLYHAGDGSGRLFANDSRGKLWLIDRRSGDCRLFLDLARARGRALLTYGPQMGFRSFAFHPDFSRRGLPGHLKLYTISTETVGSRAGGTTVLGGPFRVEHHDVVAEWSVDAGNPTQVRLDSRRELLRIAQYRMDHNADQLMFNPNARPGEDGYGMMFIGVGDGGNWPSRPDPFDQAQDPRRALGKILRIDPLRSGDQAYRIPLFNPFRGRPGWLEEIWALGLRHPQNLSFDRGGSGALLITDIGQNQIEEVNLGRKGANYGWPLREGTFATNRGNPDILYELPGNDRGFDYPVVQYDHGEGRELGKAAIVGGFVYRGAAVPALFGHYLFGDLVSGRVFHVPVRELRQGRQTAARELTLRRRGHPVTLRALVGGANRRVDLRFGQDEAGEVYVLTKQDGLIRKLARA